VSGWTNQPPAVTINTPVDGYMFPPGAQVTVLASVTNYVTLAEVDYFANSSLIGTATNPPYSIQWTTPSTGRYALVAKAADRQGAVTSSQPLNISVVFPPFPLGAGWWGPRVLPTGQLLVFYLTTLNRYRINFSDSVLFTNFVDAGRLNYDAGYGMYVDESAPNSPRQARFYRIVLGN
jgi:hypothetical protein